MKLFIPLLFILATSVFAQINIDPGGKIKRTINKQINDATDDSIYKAIGIIKMKTKFIKILRLINNYL